MTLQTKRGNAFDTASLLIALLARRTFRPLRYARSKFGGQGDELGGRVIVPQAADQPDEPGRNTCGRQSPRAEGQPFLRFEHVWVGGIRGLCTQSWSGEPQAQHLGAVGCLVQQYQFTQGMTSRPTSPKMPTAVSARFSRARPSMKPKAGFRTSTRRLSADADQNYQTQVTKLRQRTEARRDGGRGAGHADDHPERIVRSYWHTALHAHHHRKRNSRWFPTTCAGSSGTTCMRNDTDRAFDNPFISYKQSTRALRGEDHISFSPASQADQNTIQQFPAAAPCGWKSIRPSELPQSLPGI